MGGLGLFSRGDKQNPWIARGEAAAEKEQFADACAHYIRAAEIEPSYFFTVSKTYWFTT